MTGLKACRWEMFGIDPDVDVTVPYMQGIKLPISDSRFKTEKLQDREEVFWRVRVAKDAEGRESSASETVLSLSGTNGLTIYCFYKIYHKKFRKRNQHDPSNS